MPTKIVRCQYILARKSIGIELHCQNAWGRKIKIGGDTLVACNIHQVKQILHVPFFLLGMYFRMYNLTICIMPVKADARMDFGS